MKTLYILFITPIAWIGLNKIADDNLLLGQFLAVLFFAFILTYIVKRLNEIKDDYDQFTGRR
jgi:hypothetical protein